MKFLLLLLSLFFLSCSDPEPGSSRQCDILMGMFPEGAHVYECSETHKRMQLFYKGSCYLAPEMYLPSLIQIPCPDSLQKNP